MVDALARKAEVPATFADRLLGAQAAGLTKPSALRLTRDEVAAVLSAIESTTWAGARKSEALADAREKLAAMLGE